MSVISNLMVKIGADSSGLRKELKDTQKAIDSSFGTQPITNFANHVDATGKNIEAMIGRMKTFAAVAAAGFGLSSMIQDAVSAGDNLYRLGQRMHITAGEAGTLTRIMGLTGGDVESLSKSMMRLDKSYTSVSTEGERVRAILSAVDVELTNQNGQLLPVNEQLKRLAAGYKKANEAGYGQEYIMNTLGVRGMALVSTLEQYNEASEAAGKVKTVGLDPKTMHELAIELKVMQMEAKQIQLALVMGFGPVIKEILPDILSGLQLAASFLRENKSEIASITTSAVKFYSVMKGIGMIGGAANSLLGFWGQIKVAAVETAAVTEAAESGLTAQQMAYIDKMVAKSKQGYMQKEAAAIRAAQKAGLASDEARIKLEKNLLAIQAESEKTAATISSAFKAHFMQVNKAGNAMAVTAGKNIASISSQTVAEGTLTKAISEEGNAATVAGMKNKTAKTTATQATVAQTAATRELTAAHVAEGNAVAGAGLKTMSFSTMAIRGIRTVGSAVLALTGGWIGLAAAIAYATYCAYEFKKQQQKDEEDHTYTVDGKEYIEKDGRFFTKGFTNSDGEYVAKAYNDPVGFSDIGGKLVNDEVTNEKLQAAWWERHKNDEDYKAELEKEEMDQRMQEADLRLAELMQNLQSGDSENSYTEKASRNYEVEIPIGKVVAALSNNHVSGEWWMGGATQDESIQCDSFTANIYHEAGISEIGGYSTNNNTGHVINDEAFRAAGAWHENDGYQPQSGDLVGWDWGGGSGHYGIYDADSDTVTTRDSSGGVQHRSMADAELLWGAPSGFGSIAEATGGMTSTESVDEAGKKILDAASKLGKAKDDAMRLFNSMETEIGRETKTRYEFGMDQVAANVRNRQNEINKLKNSGVDTKQLESELKDYESVLKENVVKAWIRANEDIKASTKQTLAENVSDYKEAAQAEYEATLNRLKREREDKEKELLRDKEDAESRLAIDEWYAAESAKAKVKRDKSVRSSFERRITDLMESGDMNAIKTALDSTDARASVFLEGQQNLAKLYVDCWKTAHMSVSDMVATLGNNINNTLSTSLKEFIMGTKTAADVFHDFGKMILSTIAEIAAKRMAAQIVGGILGGANFYGLAKGGPIPAFGEGGSLAGGLIKGAGTGTSDSILAFLEKSGHFIRLSDGEFVMTAEATRKNRPMLEAMNAGAYSNGGSIMAPSIQPGYYEGYSGFGTSAPKGGVIVNITNNTKDEVTTSEANFDQSMQRYVLDIVIDGAQRNVNGFRSNMQAAMS